MEYESRVIGQDKSRPQKEKVCYEQSDPYTNAEPRLEVQMGLLKIMYSAIGQQHTEQPEFINEGEVDQNAEQCHDICPLPAKLTDDKTTELSNQSLESENVCLKKMLPSKKGFAIAALKNELRKLTGNSVNTSLQAINLGKTSSDNHQNQSVVRTTTELTSKDLEFKTTVSASKVGCEHRLVQKPVTTHHLTKRRESALQKLIT
ncbi:hypothetical protein Tco_0186546 [Tanacetum coccineum]